MAKGKKTETAAVEEPATPEAPVATPIPAASGGEKISKVDAIRQTVADGVEKPSEGVEYIKKKFGIEVSAAYFSIEKGKMKKGGGAKKTPGRKPRAVAAISAPSANGSIAGGNPADLARQVKHLVQQFGAVAVSDMLAVFTE